MLLLNSSLRKRRGSMQIWPPITSSRQLPLRHWDRWMKKDQSWYRTLVSDCQQLLATNANQHSCDNGCRLPYRDIMRYVSGALTSRTSASMKTVLNYYYYFILLLFFKLYFIILLDFNILKYLYFITFIFIYL